MKLNLMIAVSVVALVAAGCSKGDSDAAQHEPLSTVEQPRGTSGTDPDAAVSSETARLAKTADAPPVRPAQPATAPEASRAGVNSDALVLQDFSKRIEAYMELRKRAAKEAPKLKESDDPTRNISAQKAQAMRIAEFRANAKPGDIFTPEIRSKFRRLLAPTLKGEDGRDVKKVLKDDAPSVSEIPFKVNAKYPDNAPLPTVPASILMTLPTLPEGLEYRLIGKHLILLDVDAEIIVDYIPNATA